MRRIIWHWSAGGHKANATDKRHYHIIIQGDGSAVTGDFPISANRAPISGGYAAHTANLNSGSIGIALAAMRGAKERPFTAGPSPITPAQVAALARVTAGLCREYGIPVTRETVLSHAEVQPTLGVVQAGKWDIMWLPGMAAPGDPVAVGDKLRELVKGHIDGHAPPKPRPIDPLPAPVFPALAIAAAVAVMAAGLFFIFGS